MKKISISKNLQRFALRLINGFLIASALTLVNNPNFQPSVGYTQDFLTGTVDYSYLGVKLTIPNGWMGQLSDEFLFLGSNTETGRILLTLNQATSVEELKQEANAGWSEPGFQLTRSGEFEQIGANGIGAEFNGYYEGSPVKAFMAGVINPHGDSVTILAIATATEYDARKPALVKEIANSLQFSVAQEAPQNNEWRTELADVILEYRSFDSGASSTRTITLCSNKSFSTYNSESNYYEDSLGNSSALLRGSEEGNWKIISSAEGESLLQLNYSDGNVAEYALERGTGLKVYLNGVTYYRKESGC